jgi:hypothetical protein
MPTLDVSTEPISKPILDPDDPSYALKFHDDPRIPLKHSKLRSHEDHKEDQEERRQWLENSYATEGIDKAETLRIEPKPDPKGEVKSIPLINITHPSLEEALDKINLRVTNLRKILDNKISN